MHFSSSPLVAQVILANTSQLAKDLIPQPIEAFKIFDQASKNVKACTSLCQIIFFLWGAVHHKIPPITMAFDSSPTGSSWAIALHSACIIQTTHYHNQQETQSGQNLPNLDSHTKAFAEISKNLSSMRADSDRVKLKESEDDDKKKEKSSSWKSIPPLLQNISSLIHVSFTFSFLPKQQPPADTPLQEIYID
jgi:hypothetical protein